MNCVPRTQSEVMYFALGCFPKDEASVDHNRESMLLSVWSGPPLSVWREWRRIPRFLNKILES